MNLKHLTGPRRFAAVVLLGLAASVLFIACADRDVSTPTRQEPLPSIILIVIDTLRADYLGSYGFDGRISPHLDELAAESMLFRRCSSQAPWTTPSMASMMTSLYPDAHGVHLAPDDPRDQKSWRQRWTRAIPESTTTLAECLRDRGYRTAAFIANPFLAKGLGFEQGFEDFDESAAISRDRDSTMLLHSSLEWLRSMASGDHPTFLYLHLMDVHGPYTAPDTDYEAIQTSAGLGPATILPQRGFRRIQPYLRTPSWTKAADRNELRLWRGRYAAGVHAADRRLGGFFQTLRDEGLWDDRLVVVTSDHGEELFDHGGWDHGFSLHEHQLHVPLIVRHPGNRHAGTRLDDLVRLVDLMPTLIRMTNATGPDGMTGRDLLSVGSLNGDRNGPRTAFATSVKEHPGTTSIFDGRYKLISDLTSFKLRLFDIQNDPGELEEISAREPEVVSRLSKLLAAEIARVEAGDAADADPEQIPSDQLERLRELGYLQ